MKNHLEEWVKQKVAEISGETPPNTDLILTELRKAIRVEPGDYIIIFQEDAVNEQQKAWLGQVAEELWRNDIRLHAVEARDVNGVRFVRVESPETIKVEET